MVWQTDLNLIAGNFGGKLFQDRESPEKSYEQTQKALFSLRHYFLEHFMQAVTNGQCNFLTVLAAFIVEIISIQNSLVQII